MTLAQKLEILRKIHAEQSLNDLRIALLLVLDEVEQMQRERPYPSQMAYRPINGDARG